MPDPTQTPTPLNDEPRRLAPWERCGEHGPAAPRVWACPACLVELRSELAAERAARQDAQRQLERMQDDATRHQRDMAMAVMREREACAQACAAAARACVDADGQPLRSAAAAATTCEALIRARA
jgi:hypothetical protein